MFGLIFFIKRWPVGQAVKTSPFHGGNMGSIPVRVTKTEPGFIARLFIYAAVVELADTQDSRLGSAAGERKARRQRSSESDAQACPQKRANGEA